MKKIILDTNMLLVPTQFNVNIFEEIEKIVEGQYQLIVLDSIIKELEKIAGTQKKDSSAAKVALQLIKNRNIRVIKAHEKSTDKSIIEMVDDDTIVATNDKALKERLKKRNVKIIYLKSKKYLEMV